MSLRARLGRLEQRLGGGDDGCQACRDHRGHIVVVTSRRLPDGTTAPEGEWPAPCQQCGEVAERLIDVVEVVVETCEEADRLAAEGRIGPGGA